MKITIVSTDKIVILKPGELESGIPARVWEGKTNTGIKVVCFIPRIGHNEDAPSSVVAEFTKELQECKKPSPEVAAIPMRLII